MPRVRVEYARKVAEAGTFSSLSVGGSVEQDINEDTSWEDVYETEFEVLKSIIDSKFETITEGEATRAVPTASSVQPSTLPSATAELSQSSGIVPKQPVAYRASVAGKVWHNSVGTNKEHIKVRIDNLVPIQDQSPVLPGVQVDLKSFEREVINTIISLQLNKGDSIIARGYFDEPFNGKHDLRAQAVERAG